MGKNMRSLSPTRFGRFSMTAIAILEFLADERTVTARIDSLGNLRRVASMKVINRNDATTAVPRPVTAKIIQGENLERSPFAVA